MRIVWHVRLCSLAQSACELTVGMSNVPAERDHEQRESRLYRGERVREGECVREEAQSRMHHVAADTYSYVLCHAFI